MKMGVFNRFPD